MCAIRWLGNTLRRSDGPAGTLCYCVSILKTDDEFWSDSAESRNEVKDVPQGFRDWVKDNAERIEKAEKRGTQPYFIVDNKKVVDGILKPQAVTLVKLPHIEDYISHYSGKVMASPMHGSNELDENLRIGKKVADLLGETVYLLPRINPSLEDAARLRKEYLPEGVFENKNPDFLIKGLIAEGKTINYNKTKRYSRENIKQIIENHIKKAKKQADNMVFNILGDIPKEWIDQTIINYLNRTNVERLIIYFFRRGGFYT